MAAKKRKAPKASPGEAKPRKQKKAKVRWLQGAGLSGAAWQGLERAAAAGALCLAAPAQTCPPPATNPGWLQDPNAPKRATTAFFYFSNEQRPVGAAQRCRVGRCVVLNSAKALPPARAVSAPPCHARPAAALPNTHTPTHVRPARCRSASRRPTRSSASVTWQRRWAPSGRR